MRPSKAVQDSVRAYRRALPWKFLLLPALVAWQAYRWDADAREVFTVHEAEVKSEIAKIRARDVRRPPLLDPPLPGNAWECYAAALDVAGKIPRKGMTSNFFPAAAEAALLEVGYQPVLRLLEEAQRRDELEVLCEFEKGRAGAYRTLRPGTVGWDLPRLALALHQEGRDEDAVEVVVTLLGAMADLRRGGSLWAAGETLDRETSALDVMKRILAGHALGATRLESLAGSIDRLVNVRPDFHEIVACEITLQKQSVLLDEFDWGRRSWRQAYSATLTRVAALTELKRMGAELSRLRNRPAGRWQRDAFVITEDSKLRLAAAMMSGLAMDYGREAGVQEDFQLLRAAVAMARYREETGEEAADPEVLVPQYLPAVPVSPANGETLLCCEGWVGFHENARLGWTVRRRSEAAPAALR